MQMLGQDVCVCVWVWVWVWVCVCVCVCVCVAPGPLFAEVPCITSEWNRLLGRA